MQLTVAEAKKRRKAYRSYLKSDAWRRKRAEVMHRDNGRCTALINGKRCYSQVELQVHHLTYERFGKEKLSDLITVCGLCHAQIHKKQGDKHHGEK